MHRAPRRLRAALLALCLLGTLLIAGPASAEEPALTVSVQIDPVGTVNRATGVATITGTVTCGGTYGDEANAYAGAELRQVVGRTLARGGGWDGGACNSPFTWRVHPWGDFAFGPGKASVQVWAEAWFTDFSQCEDFDDYFYDCESVYADTTATAMVHLRAQR